MADKRLDKLLAEGKTLDQIMAEIHAFGRKPTVQSDYDDELRAKEEAANNAQSNRAADAAAESLTPKGTVKRYIHGATEIGPKTGAAMMGASFIPGAGIPLSLLGAGLGAAHAVTAPGGVNKTELALASLGLVPELNVLRQGGRAAVAAKKAAAEAERAVGATRSRLKDVYGAGDMGAAPKPIDPWSFRNAPRRDPVVNYPEGDKAAWDALVNEGRVPVGRPAPRPNPWPEKPVPPKNTGGEAAADAYDNGATPGDLGFLDREHAAAMERMKAARDARRNALPSFASVGDVPSVGLVPSRQGVVTPTIATGPSRPALTGRTQRLLEEAPIEGEVVPPTGPRSELDALVEMMNKERASARAQSIPTLDAEVMAPESVRALDQLALPEAKAGVMSNASDRLKLGLRQPHTLLVNEVTRDLEREAAGLMTKPFLQPEEQTRLREITKALSQRMTFAQGKPPGPGKPGTISPGGKWTPRKK